MADRKPKAAAFVGNLPADPDKDELAAIFSQFGEVASVRLFDGKNFAFVNFNEEESALAAIAHRNHTYRDSPIAVKPASRKSGGGDNVIGIGMKGQSDPRTMPNLNRYNMGPVNGSQNKPDLVSTVSQKWTPKTGMNNDIKPDGVSWKQSVDLQPGESVGLMVTHVESPITFFGQIVDPVKRQDLLDMFHILETLCNSCEPFSGIPEVDKIYAARFSQDNSWYRCKVLRKKGDSQCEVQYIDYGNKELVHNSELRMLPAKQVTKPYAIKFALFGLKSLYDSDNIGFHQGVEKLKTIILDKEVKARVADVYNPSVHRLSVPIEVDSAGIDVNQEILGAGFASKAYPPPGVVPFRQEVPGPRRTEQTQAQFSGQNTWPPQSFEGVEHWNEIPGSNRKPFKIDNASNSWDMETQLISSPPSSIFSQQPAPTIDQWDATMTEPVSTTSIPQPLLSMVNPSGNQSMRQPIIPTKAQMSQPPPGGDTGQLQRELHIANCEISRLRNEISNYHMKTGELDFMEKQKNDAILEQAKMKGEVKQLTLQLHELYSKLQDANLNNKVKSLLVNVQRVKQLRLQFPSEYHARDNIAWAARLLQDDDKRISFDLLDIRNNVELVKEAYETAQDNIKACVEEAKLPDLIEARDERRQELHNALLKFNEAIVTMPLDSRRHQLQEAWASLQITHGNFLMPEMNGVLSLSDVLAQYADWKSQKMVEFRERRVMTNTCHNSLNGSLILLQQELALDVPSSGENPKTIANLDDPLQKYAAAVDREIKVTDIEHSSDSAFITMVLKTMCLEICRELADIQRLVQLREEYTKLAAQLGSWLSTKPDVTELHDVRKRIKALKSKLRHKLADKQDLEESDDSDKEELNRINADLRTIREDLQEAFRDEDGQLAELANLSENHFPELAMQLPEAGIDNEAVYGGLVKIGRILDYFNTEPLRDCDKPSVMKSSFCKVPIVLKEFIVDDSLGVRKGEFLRRAMAYNHIQHPNLVPIQAIFSIKDKRNTYIQLPYYDTCIYRLLHAGALTTERLHPIVCGILRGLNCLHEAKLVHGAIHPNNIFISPEGEGILAEFDFGKTLQQRIERNFVTVNGLHFIAPEVVSSGQISRASDVYLFGLLLLWMIKGKDPIKMRSNGVPDLDSMDIDNAALLQLLRACFAEKPGNRPSTQELLQSPYVNMPPDSPDQSPRDSSPQCQTLQLRPKQPSPPSCEKTHSGILKNVSPSSTPPPDASNTPNISATPPLDPYNTLNISDTLPPVASNTPNISDTLPLDPSNTPNISDTLPLDPYNTPNISDTLPLDPYNTPNILATLPLDASNISTESSIPQSFENNTEPVTTPDREVAGIFTADDIDGTAQPPDVVPEEAVAMVTSDDNPLNDSDEAPPLDSMDEDSEPEESEDRKPEDAGSGNEMVSPSASTTVGLGVPQINVIGASPIPSPSPEQMDKSDSDDVKGSL